jgi:hypothetical protein
MALKDQKEVLKAWIDGETIQYKASLEWYDCIKFTDVEDFSVFQNEGTYRIKPKEIVTTTYIKRDIGATHATYSNGSKTPNLKLTWSPDGETLIKAEVI